MAKMNIENVVASTYLGQELDLNKIEDALEGAEYNPQQFPGLVYRLKEPKTATLIFRSGKVVCTGAKCREDVKVAISKVAKDLEKADVKITIEPKIEVQNIVASSDLEQEINLNTVAITLGLEKVEYEPEQFPGLVYRLDDPKVVVLLFGSGKMVCTGAKVPRTSHVPSTRSLPSSGPPASWCENGVPGRDAIIQPFYLLLTRFPDLTIQKIRIPEVLYR